MSLYNMIFGVNAQSDMLLAVIGLKRVDVERFRDAHAEPDGSKILIYTRTGGGNREDYPNLTMRKRPEWAGSADDDFDSTYCTDTFSVPEQWRADVAGLSDPLSHGLRAEFAKHLAATLRREPTESDKAQAAYDAEALQLKRLSHFMANGHTFVPRDDYAMEEALKLAEANGGKLRTCWGILPISIVVKTNDQPYPKAPNPDTRSHVSRIAVNYDFRWSIDEWYWAHCMDRWATKFPVTMAKIAADVETYRKRKP